MDIWNFFRKKREESEQVEHELSAVNEVEKAEQPESRGAATIAKLATGLCRVGIS